MSESTKNKYLIVEEVLKKANKSVTRKDADAAIKSYNEMVQEMEYLRDISIKQSQQRLTEKLQAENQSLKEEILNMKRQIYELRHRLSSLAGHKMTDGNPGIADLSDPYRPTNLAEKFHQIYDDGWTPAFEFLDKTVKLQEPKIIDFLANIIKKVDKVCAKTSESQISKMQHYITDDFISPKVEIKNGTVVASAKSKMDENQEKLVDKLLRELRKSFGGLSVRALVELFDKCFMEELRKAWNIPATAKDLNEFVAQCVEIIWLMKIQHPPMTFLWQYENEQCDKERFAFYTKRGEKVKQTVWPAVLLHKDGALVAKGVIQAI